MRVTNQQILRSSLNAVNDARNRMQRSQEVAMTGRRVTTASDDPTAASRARLIEDLQAAAKSHAANTEFGVSRLQTTDDALSEAANQITRAREIALSMSNDTMSAQQRSAAATEVAQLRQNVIDIINTQHLGEYVFAHVDTRTPPFDQATNDFSYDVDAFQSVRRVEIGPSQVAEIGASGSHAFAQRAGAPGSIDVPAILATLENNLRSNDPEAIRGTIEGVTQAFDQVLAERAHAGVRMQRLQQAEQAAQQSVSVYESLRSDLIDADAADAFSQLSLAQNTMQAAVTVAARMLGPSLLDVL